ncbi:ROK family transcriptional regulator [Ahrensia marina]|uniref:ROK family transcriptional regulator n=1 Tax=Ahrensia marina TaxID=1514904 RepID=A0A0N0VLU6_9HYPH|nr:ROK family transcriptional regulator [Ahrensia marina]KPB02014.1 ROK family transcriptional regulator [Ahrensia marina]
MNVPKVRSLSGGANQSGLRDYNERLLLSMLLRNGPMPGSDLARRAGLSAQTVSIILRKLENDGFLERGAPQRGRVGKPSIPMGLAASGAYAFGLKIGRRNADLILIDFKGGIRAQKNIAYDYPMPDQIFGFLEAGMADINSNLSPLERERVCGIGLAAPFELWNWYELAGAPAEEFLRWRDIDLREQVSRFSALPIYIMNDATAACRAEHVYGRGKEFRDYAYFFIAAFVGGGIVLNHSVFEGHQGNAGALGSLRSTGPNGESRQLIDIASIHLLEARLEQAGIDKSILWKQPQDWSGLTRYVDAWMGETAQELAKAALSTCSVIDFEAVLIDGAFPENIRFELAERTSRYIANQDMRGLIPPKIEAGSIGGNARALGAASGPIFAQYLLNTNVGLAEVQ